MRRTRPGRLLSVPTARTLATAGDDHLVRLWDPDFWGRKVPTSRAEFAGHGHRLVPDGSVFACASKDKDRRLCLWDPAKGQMGAVLDGS